MAAKQLDGSVRQRLRAPRLLRRARRRQRRCTRVRTWAPMRQTPVIQFHFNWTHISVIAGLNRTRCMFRLHEGSIKKAQHVEFLKALRARMKQPLLIIWDGPEGASQPARARSTWTPPRAPRRWRSCLLTRRI